MKRFSVRLAAILVFSFLIFSFPCQALEFGARGFLWFTSVKGDMGAGQRGDPICP